MICTHEDCFSCPYPDCVVNDEKERKAPPKKRGRKPMDPEEKRKKRSAYGKKYYAEHKDHLKDYMNNYYREHKAEYRARELKYKEQMAFIKRAKK